MKVYSNHTFTHQCFLNALLQHISMPQNCQLKWCTKCQNNRSTTFSL